MEQARKVYEEMRDRKPFFMNEEHIAGGRVTRNQYGTQYAFPDGSRLTVSRRQPDGTNSIKQYDRNGFCLAILARRVAIESK